MFTAFVRPPDATLVQCELTFIPRVPIDIARASAQHVAYASALLSAGARLEFLPALPGCPDAVFVEDTAVVLNEVAILARSGVPTRQVESESVGAALARHRPIWRLRPPATMDGGDVLRIGRRVYVGRSSRTNFEAITQLRALLAPLRYIVIEVPITRCLHLKTACSVIGKSTVLINPEWVDPNIFARYRHEVIRIDASEPWAANALRIGERVMLPAGSPRTQARLLARGVSVEEIDIGEFQKAEAGLTCMSVVVEG